MQIFGKNHKGTSEASLPLENFNAVETSNDSDGTQAMEEGVQSTV
jgi:hypothetical protein